MQSEKRLPRTTDPFYDYLAQLLIKDGILDKGQIARDKDDNMVVRIDEELYIVNVGIAWPTTGTAAQHMDALEQPWSK